MTDERVWEGADGLEEMLVPVGTLIRHPRNPRRGKVDLIAESLQRFGQVRPILTDGIQIVAGNHTFLAAQQLGWTHIAVVQNDFASDEETRAYLLADNRIPELGGYDEQVLLAQLEALEEAGLWAGTGYTADDLDDLRAMQAQQDRHAGGGDPAVDPELGSPWTPQAGASTSEVVLLIPDGRFTDFDGYVKVLQKEYGGSSVGLTETVFRAVTAAAARTPDP